MSRYILTPAPDGEGEFTAMTGYDERNGWVTLLQNTTEAVVMLGATAAAFV